MSLLSHPPWTSGCAFHCTGVSNCGDQFLKHTHSTVRPWNLWFSPLVGVLTPGIQLEGSPKETSPDMTSAWLQYMPASAGFGSIHHPNQPTHSRTVQSLASSHMRTNVCCVPAQPCPSHTWTSCILAGTTAWLEWPLIPNQARSQPWFLCMLVSATNWSSLPCIPFSICTYNGCGSLAQPSWPHWPAHTYVSGYHCLPLLVVSSLKTVFFLTVTYWLTDLKSKVTATDT